MKKLLFRLQECIESRFPATAASLKLGASERQIEDLERRIGIRLPDQVRVLYRWHNGQSDETSSIGLFFGLPFLPIDRVIQHWDFECRTLNGSTSDELDEWAKGYSCLPAGTIQRVVMNRSWVPLADDSAGSYLGLDFNPDVHGSVAQVISFGGREPIRVRAAENIANFLEDLLFMYEQGQYELIEEDEDEFSIATVSPSTHHFLHYLRMKAQAESNS